MPSKDLWKSVVLVLQKFETLFWNDLKLFLRDRKSVVLVALTPFIILAILINIYGFSDVAENIRGVKLGICDKGNANLDLEMDIFDFIQFTGDCESEVLSLVREGELRGAVIVPGDFRENLIGGKGTELKVYVDNTKGTTALVATNAIKAYASDVNQQMGEAFIREAWKNLDELNDNLRVVVKNLKKAEPVARELQQRMDTVKQEHSNIDFDSYQATLDNLVAYMDFMEYQLEQSKPLVSNIPYLLAYNVTPDTSTLETYKNRSATARTQYCANNSIVPNPVCFLLDQTDSLALVLDQQLQDIDTFNFRLNSKIDELNTASAGLNAAVDSLNQIFDSANNQEFRDDITEIKSGLVEFQQKTTDLETSIANLDKSINKFLTDLQTITADLENTIIVLDEYTDKDPSTILRPITVDSEDAFEDTTEIFNRLPAFIGIVLLFITLFISSSMIVGERKSGTMARIFLSPISMFFFMFEKMIYLLLLSLLSTMSMFLAAVLFGVPFIFSSGLLFLFLVAGLMNVALGVLIGSVSKSENTSLLTCLVIGFPLMFLSGAFSPPELMNQLVRTISSYLPLTLTINSLERLMIYHTGIDWSVVWLMLGITVVLYIFSVLKIRKTPTLK